VYRYVIKMANNSSYLRVSGTFIISDNFRAKNSINKLINSLRNIWYTLFGTYRLKTLKLLHLANCFIFKIRLQFKNDFLNISCSTVIICYVPTQVINPATVPTEDFYFTPTCALSISVPFFSTSRGILLYFQEKFLPVHKFWHPAPYIGIFLFINFFYSPSWYCSWIL
jgi:hypothetical protein